MKTYFSADFHLQHANVIRFDNRPFKHVDDMDKAIIKNCMQLFKPGDQFYFLGDFSMRGTNDKSESYFQELKSSGVQMFFIKGNHDKKDTIKLYNKYGIYLGEQKKIRVGEQEIVLNHYRMDVWDKSHHGTWHLHGHSHHSLPIRRDARCMDVGINGVGYNYTPVDFEYVSEVMKYKEWKPIDHHGR